MRRSARLLADRNTNVGWKRKKILVGKLVIPSHCILYLHAYWRMVAGGMDKLWSYICSPALPTYSREQWTIMLTTLSETAAHTVNQENFNMQNNCGHTELRNINTQKVVHNILEIFNMYNYSQVVHKRKNRHGKNLIKSEVFLHENFLIYCTKVLLLTDLVVPVLCTHGYWYYYLL